MLRDPDRPETVYQVIPQGRSGKLLWFPYQVCIALLAGMSGLSALVDPDAERLTRFAGLERPLWVIMLVAAFYLVSGGLMLWGLWKDNIQVELAGNLLIIVGVLIETIADVIYNAPEGLFKANLVFVIVLFAAGCRIFTITHGRRLILVKLEQ